MDYRTIYSMPMAIPGPGGQPAGYIFQNGDDLSSMPSKYRSAASDMFYRDEEFRNSEMFSMLRWATQDPVAKKYIHTNQKNSLYLVLDHEMLRKYGSPLANALEYVIPGFYSGKDELGNSVEYDLHGTTTNLESLIKTVSGRHHVSRSVAAMYVTIHEAMHKQTKEGYLGSDQPAVEGFNEGMIFSFAASRALESEMYARTMQFKNPAEAAKYREAAQTYRQIAGIAYDRYQQYVKGGANVPSDVKKHVDDLNKQLDGQDGKPSEESLEDKVEESEPA